MSDTKTNPDADKAVSSKSLKQGAEILLKANLRNLAERVKAGGTLKKHEVELLESVKDSADSPAEEDNEYYDSMQSCAAQLGIPIERLKLAKRSGCPAFRASRVYKAPLIKWFIDNKHDEDDGVDWSQERVKIAALRDEIRLKKDQKKAIDFDLVQFALARGMAAMFAQIDRSFALELPPSLKGLSELEIQARCHAAAESFKEALRAELLKIGEQEPQMEEATQ